MTYKDRSAWSSFLEFDLAASASTKTSRWVVLSRRHRDVLGEIKWYAPWRQYAFFPGSGSLYNHDCLHEIAAFIRQATVRHQMEVQQRHETRGDRKGQVVPAAG